MTTTDRPHFPTTRSGASARRVTWAVVGAAVVVQIVYPLVPATALTAVTLSAVLLFAAAALLDVATHHGARGAALLLAVAGGGGLVAEAVGVRTGWPFGSYAYTDTLGPILLGVPLVVPLAWTMMAWPALVVGRTLARRPVAVTAVGAVALTVWDVFLDPQMVAAGHWTWAHPDPGLPFVAGIPLTNYAGWLLVSTLIVGTLHRLLPDGATRPARFSPAAALYLWTYASSVLAHLVFFGLPGSALVGAVVMGGVAVPYAVVLLRRHRTRTGSLVQDGSDLR